MGIIYSATFPNGKVYIGQTTQTLNQRISQHIWAALEKKDDFMFHKAIRKYGKDNITWEILEEIEDSKELLNEREQFWITEKNAYCLGGNGYNMTKGGDNYEHRVIFSDEETIKSICLDYMKYGNGSYLAKKYKVSYTTIMRVVKNNCKDWHLYKYDKKGSPHVFSDSQEKEIYDYFLKTGSIKRTVDKFNSNKRTIGRVLHRLDSNYGEYVWRFSINKEDSENFYNDYKSIGDIEIVADKYHITTNSARNLLTFLDPNYTQYTKRKKRKK